MPRWIKQLVLFSFILEVVFSIHLFGDSHIRSHKTVISMSLEDYREYLNHNRPLDRLFMMDNICYFLVNKHKTDSLRKQGIFFQSPQLDLRDGNFTGSGSIGDYHTYPETVEMLQDLAIRYADMATVFSVGQSLEGREIYVIKISDNVTEDENEPNIFISGCHHAREWISVEVPLLFVRYLLENYSTNLQVQQAVNGSQIYIMPIQNPDGLEYSIHYYRMWRKNRRYNGDLSWGVDPNRNYGYKWGYDNTGSSPIPDDEVYRGPYAFSEPETRAVRDFLIDHPPSGSLNFHNYSQLILYPWGYTDLPTADDDEMEQIACRMAELIFQVSGRVYQYGQGATAIYPTNGDTDDWIYGIFGTPSFTVELPPELFIQSSQFDFRFRISRIRR